MTRRPLTPEEETLWQQVKRSTKPLAQRDVEMWGYRDVAKKITHAPTSIIPASPYPHISTSPSQGVYANIDRNTAERFRKGRYSIDATLDLHGLTRDKAYEHLHRFVTSHHRRGSRCLLVITGKGLVLREQLPHWFMHSDFGHAILAFDKAQPKDGGSGAYYVLLRRKR